MKKIILVSAITIMLICTTYFLVRLYIYEKYNFNKDDIAYYNERRKDFEITDAIEIETRLLKEDEEYYEFGDIKIKNYFDGLTNKSNDSFARFQSEHHMLSFGKHFTENMIDVIKNEVSFVNTIYSSDFKLVDASMRKEYLEENNIKNDIDFFKFIVNKEIEEVDIFTGINCIKEHATVMSILMLYILEFEEIILIEGDYQGYILVNENSKECYIYHNNETYIFSFVGDTFTKEIINDTLNTLVLGEV